MNRFYQFIGLGLLASVLCLGCSKSEEEVPDEAVVDPLVGQWVLSITQQYQPGDYRNVNTVLLDIAKDEESYKAEVLGSKPALPRAKLKSFAVDDGQMHVVLLSDRYTFDFQGTISDRLIQGTMDQGGLYIEPAQMLKQPPVRNISDVPNLELPKNFMEHQKLLQDTSEDGAEAVSLLDNYAAFLKFCENHPDSPLAIILDHALVNVLPEKATSEQEVEEFADAYLKRAKPWGPRMQLLARFNLGKSLVGEPKFADLGLEYLKQAETQMDAVKRDEVGPQLKFYRQVAQETQTRQKAKAAFMQVVEGKKDAMDTLRTLSDDSPFDPVLMFRRAEAARRTGLSAEALKYFGRLAVWPKLQATLQSEPAWQESSRELPEGRLLELWAKEKGSEAGLDEYKNQLYDEALKLIAKQIGEPPARTAGNRVNVVELFTGTNCPPCLGADLATGALEKLLPPSQLVVLRYHLHTNGLDPLTNPRSAERFETLLRLNPSAQAATPSVFINGQMAASSIGGYLDNAPQIGKSLLAELVPALETKTPLKLKLSAYQHEGEISISAKLEDVPESLRDKLRVMFLLAEEELVFPAPNGIRRHEMLVRWFFEEGKSVALPGKGDLQYASKVPVKDIRDLLETSTRSAALQMQAKLGRIPLELDDLRLVALVQNPETNEILQAGVVPVNIYDTAPMRPQPPTANVPKPAPVTGPMLVVPSVGSSSEPKPANAEKPME